jgi:hypothetical protein
VPRAPICREQLIAGGAGFTAAQAQRKSLGKPAAEFPVLQCALCQDYRQAESAKDSLL